MEEEMKEGESLCEGLRMESRHLECGWHPR